MKDSKFLPQKRMHRWDSGMLCVITDRQNAQNYDTLLSLRLSPGGSMTIVRMQPTSIGILCKAPGCMWGGEKTSAAVEQMEVILLVESLTLRLISHYISSSDQFRCQMLPGQLDLKLLIPPIPLGTSYVSVSRPPSSFCSWWLKPHLRNARKDRVRKRYLPGEFLSLGSRLQRTYIIFSLCQVK